MQKPFVTIYADGSFKSNQNGGWACLLQCGTMWQLLSGSCYDTTNNRMEFTAVIMGLRHLTMPCRVLVISDSMLICNTINEWIYRWAKRDFITKSNKPRANQDLIQELWDHMQRHEISAEWIKAHTGKKDINSLGNSCCDWFAQHSARQI